jgi:hypothetical protein
MKIGKIYDSLCKPAKFYLIISLVSFVLILLQNIGARNSFTLGSYSVPHTNPMLILLFNAAYIAVWTWMLNMVCKINTNISWVIVLFPIILLFIGFALMIFAGNKSRA